MYFRHNFLPIFSNNSWKAASAWTKKKKEKKKGNIKTIKKDIRRKKKHDQRVGRRRY